MKLKGPIRFASAPRRAMLALVLILALVAPALADWQRATPGGPGGTGPTADQVAQALNDASLLFEANRGQTDSQVRYVARGDGYAVYLTDRAAVVDYRNPAAARGIPTTGPAGVALRFDLVGGQAGQPVAQQPQPGRISYFYGNDPSRWQRDVPTYGRVVYQGVYPGIDLAYYGHGGALEYDLVVAPGADPNAIRLSIAGADSLSLSGQDLLIKTALGTLRSAAPTVYQDGPNGREVVAGQYTLAADHTVSFSLGRYDSSRPVVIDPIIWSSFIGGDSDIATRPNDGGDWGIDLVTDSAGNVYLAGTSDSINYPTTAGAYQTVLHNYFGVVVSRIRADGLQLMASTYIGGTEEYTPGGIAKRSHAHGIVLDSAGNVWIAGFTDSQTYPTVNPYQAAIGGLHDAVISELNPTLTTLMYSTFVGGRGDDWGYSIDRDAANKIYVTGATEGVGFPVVNAYQPAVGGLDDAFALKLDPTLVGAAQLVYSTFLGGTGDDMLAVETFYTGNGADAYYREGGIKVDAAGNIYVAGYAGNGTFPTTANAFQTNFTGTRNAFLSKLNPALPPAQQLLYSTFLGTAGDTHATVLVLDSANNAIIGGRTQGLATTPGAFQTTFGGNTDGFVAKFNTNLSGAASLLFSTYLGGQGEDWVEGVGVNPAGYVFASGTASAGFPTTAGSPQPTNNGVLDTFLSQLNPTATTLTFSTFWGGAQSDWGSGLALAGADCAYVTGSTLPAVLPPNPQPAGTFSFPITPTNVFQPDPGDPNVPGGGGKMEGIIYKMCAPPTAAQVSGLAAAPARAGGVDVQWTSASEVDHLGFNVLRAATAKGPFQPVNATLIRPVAGTNGGGTYRFHDPAGRATDWYQIQSVDTHNTTRLYPGFAVGKTLPAQPAAPSAADLAAEGARLAAANAKALAAAPHGPLTTTAYKLLVSRSGVARITYDQLQSAGMPLAGVDPARLRLTTGPAGARSEVPLALHLATPGVFASGDSFDFIAAAQPATASDARAYYLDVAPAPAARMAQAGSAQTRPPYALSFPSTLHLEQNLIYWQQAPDLGAPQPEGPWYWVGALDSYDGVATLDVPDVTSGPASLTLSLQGFTSDAAHLNDHHLQASLNGTLLGDWRWSGRAPQQRTVTVPPGVLQAGANTLRLHTVSDTGVAHDGVYLASVDVYYTRLFRAAANSLAFSGNSGDVAVHNLSSGAALYDVTAAGAPLALASRQSGDTLFARIPGAGSRQLLVAASGGFVAPDSITPVVGDNLRAGGADYVVIAADSLLAAGQQLAALHTGDGLSTRVVPVSAIYDQFGNGAPDAAAIAAFLDYSHRAWAPAPRYAALLGSASFDAHNYLNGANPDLLPTGYVMTDYSGRTASDSSLALSQSTMAGAGGGRQPIVALGRLPARSPAEAAALVAKLQSYHATTHHWITEVGLVADAADSGDFDRASEALSTRLGSHAAQRVYESSYGAGTTTQILANLNSGRALLNFYGHGSLDTWGTGNIFNTGLVSQVNNAGRETFLTAITCFNGDYSWGPVGLVTAMVMQPTGGAIGGLSGTAISNPSGQHQLNEAFYSAVLAGKPVGDALRAGYAATTDPEIVLQFQLIGDPALALDVSR